jgi:hypothetical protein
MITTLEDIVEELADKIGVYGACNAGFNHVYTCEGCRPCWTSNLTARILEAVEIERLISKGRAGE